MEEARVGPRAMVGVDGAGKRRLARDRAVGPRAVDKDARLGDLERVWLGLGLGLRLRLGFVCGGAGAGQRLGARGRGAAVAREVEVAEVAAAAAAAAAVLVVVVARTFAVDNGLQRQARPDVLADLLPSCQRAAGKEAEPAVGGRDEAPVLQPG